MGIKVKSSTVAPRLGRRTAATGEADFGEGEGGEDVQNPVDYLLFIVHGVAVNPNPEEVAGVMYVNRGELEELLRKADVGVDGMKISRWFRLEIARARGRSEKDLESLYSYKFDDEVRLNPSRVGARVVVRDYNGVCLVWRSRVPGNLDGSIGS
ncbi:Isopentenyl-diphosphate Delta-isomerase II [Platanthera zijinensis]|uniref:Isopentenyl-diphosphate Delta-isomerase II n=1 Tax=Platanthera zijinensis TaxID=2320716 RepID=A0AAP0BLS8_9ASPA